MAIIYRKDDKVKEYIIDELVEDGGYATSYIAFNNEGQRVFLKIYKSPTGSSRVVFEPFIAQQYYMKDLLNSLPMAENILDLFEMDDMFHCQVKEFLEGFDLAKYLNEHKPDMDNKRFIASLIVYAMIRIHEKGIIHADLKKEQIFIKEDKSLKKGLSLKIIDFDFSRIPEKHEPAYRITTLYYSSPEFLKDEKVEFESDIFTLGIILYELFCGEYPYDVEGPDDYMQKVLDYKVKKAPGEINPELDESLSDLIIQMLSPNKMDRPTLQEVHDCLTSKGKREMTNKIVRLSQNGVSYRYDVSENMIIGRVQLIGFNGCEYVSGEQFVFSKTDMGWKIKVLPDSINPVYLNSSRLMEGEKTLNQNNRLFIGSIRQNIGMEIEISLVDE